MGRTRTGRSPRAASASPPGGSRSSTSSRATSRSRTRTGRAPSSRTARSTTTPSSGASSSAQGTGSRTDHSDTETIVHAYEQWGLGFAARLRGMFAVAIWDAKQRRLVLARDRFGIKPLYYRAADGELSFASELDALPKGDLDLDALEAFLATNCVPGPLSIFREIRKLPPGSRARVGGRSRVAGAIRPAGAAAGAAGRRGGARSRSAGRGSATRCAAHLVSDVPVGVLLSGGVDSGTLTAFASERSSEPVRTFSIGFEEASFDELDGARAVSARYGTLHREARAPPRRGAASPRARRRLRRAVRRLVGPADVPGLPPRRRGREGRAVGRGRRRALRRLLHLRRRRARRSLRRSGPGRPSGGRAPALLDPASELRLPREAVRTGGAPAAARAARGVEGDLLRRCPGRADGPAPRVRSLVAATRRGSPRPRGSSCSADSRTSTSAAISSTTCS